MAFLVLEGALGYDALALADLLGTTWVAHSHFVLGSFGWCIFSPHSILAQTAVPESPHKISDWDASVRYRTSTRDVHF